MKRYPFPHSQCDPHKICICDVPQGMSSTELRKKLISFGKVMCLALIDQNGIDYGEWTSQNTIKNEAELCYKFLLISGSQSRTGVVEYKTADEAERALQQKVIKIKKDTSQTMRFMTMPERLSYFLEFKFPEDSTVISDSSQTLQKDQNLRKQKPENPENVMIRKARNDQEFEPPQQPRQAYGYTGSFAHMPNRVSEHQMHWPNRYPLPPANHYYDR